MSFATVLQQLRTIANPYPGLRPFDRDESHLFFGRDQQIAELVDRLERNHFVAVVGVSGSGKSSLVRAGLIPALGRAQLSEAGRRWRTVVTRPGAAPYERLGADLTGAGLDPSRLDRSSLGLVEISRQLEADESLLVIVDQFEELFRYQELGSDGGQAGHRRDLQAARAAEYVQLLLEAARYQPPVYVALTMRSDYLGDCAEFRDLPETLNDCQYLVPRLTREQRKAAILGPLGRVEMEPALVQRLLNVTGDEPDQLPVLQHALMRTWNYWFRADPEHVRRIELSDYDAIGGLDDALNRHADELVAGTPANVAATIFKRLTARGRNSRERRNPATLSELWAVCSAETSDRQRLVNAVVDRFRQGEATFLVPRDGALEQDTYVDITHESLIRQWATLRDQWLPAEQASAKVFLDLVGRAYNWREKHGPLLIGLDLSDARQWDRERNTSSAWARHYASEAALTIVLEFIRASEAQQSRELIRRGRSRIAAAGTALVFIVLLSLVAIYFRRAAATAIMAEALARDAKTESQIMAMRSVRDPLTRALLLAELGRDDQKDEHLAVYQEAASTPIPRTLFRYTGDERAVGTGFVDGGRIVVLLSNGTIWSWPSDGRGDATTRPFVTAPSTTSRTKAGGAPIFKVAILSRDGRWIAAAAADGAVWLGRSDATGFRQIVAVDPLLPKDANALAFSGDGSQLAVGYSNYTAEVMRVDLTNGTVASKAIRLSGGHTAAIMSVDFDPAGTRLVTGALDGTLRMWNLRAPARPALELANSDSPNDSVRCVAFSPDGEWLLSGYASGAARIQRSSKLVTRALTLPGHTAAITAADFSPDGSTVVTASADETAQIWTVQVDGSSPDRQSWSLKQVGSASVLTHDAAVTAAAISTDGSSLVTTSDDGAARIWPIAPGEPRIVGRHTAAVENVTFSPDGNSVLTASDDQTAGLWSLNHTTPQTFNAYLKNRDLLPTWVRNAVFEPSDASKIITADDTGTLRLWSSKEPRVALGMLAHRGSRVYDVAFDQQRARVVTADQDKTARVWSLAALLGGAAEMGGAGQAKALPHQEPVNGVAFSRDGSKVVTASDDGVVRIWDLAGSAREPIKQFVQRGSVAVKAAFSGDGRRVVAAYRDGVARIWDMDGGDGPTELRHRDTVNAAIFSTTGKWIGTASLDGTARLWDGQSSLERLLLQHGKDSVRAVAFDADDKLVATGTEGGVVRVWRITLPALQTYLQNATTACLLVNDHVRYLRESEDMALSQYQECERRWGRTPSQVRGRLTITAEGSPPR